MTLQELTADTELQSDQVRSNLVGKYQGVARCMCLLTACMITQGGLNRHTCLSWRPAFTSGSWVMSALTAAARLSFEKCVAAGISNNCAHDTYTLIWQAQRCYSILQPRPD